MIQLVCLSQNCSSSLNSVIRRRDNKMYFARQGSTCQSSFMRQASNEKVVVVFLLLNDLVVLTFAETDPCIPLLHFKLFCQVYSAQSGMPPKSPGSTNEGCYNSCEGPLFSRPSRTPPRHPTVGAMRPVPQGFYLCGPVPPKFSRPSRHVSQQKELYSKTKTYSSESNGRKFWCWNTLHFHCWNSKFQNL